MTRSPRRLGMAPVALCLLLTACSDDESSSRATDASNIGQDAASWDASLDSGVRFDAGDAQMGSDAELAPLDAELADASSEQDSAVDAGREASPEPIVDSGAPVPRYAAAPLAEPPTYLGTSGASGACTQSFRTMGYAPLDAAPAKHPLFLYFVGTAGGPADESARFDGKAPRAVTQAMAERGFVALSVEYDNAILSIFTNKLPCLFGTNQAQSVVSKACALPNVDCSLGIATWGHSQGGLLAHLAADLEPRVRAVWTTGYGGVSGAKLPFERFRTVN